MDASRIKYYDGVVQKLKFPNKFPAKTAVLRPSGREIARPAG
jgi:hypothetical protein